MEESKNGDEKVDDVVEEEDSKQPTVVVYYIGKKDVQHDNEEEVVGEAYQASADQTAVVSVEEQTLEVEKTEDEASQASAGQITVVFVEEQTIEVAQTEVVISHQKEDVVEASQTKESKDEVINMYIKALIQYFDTQQRTRPDSERIVLADIFACQYIGRAFNVWTCNMSSLEGVELKKKSIWEQISSMQWDRIFSNCIHRGDLKVVNSKLILILWNINDNHWVLCVVSFKARKICIDDSMVDSKITNARKKIKLSPGHELIEDQISTILPKMLIWRDFADSSRPPTGSEVNDYGLNSKWTTRFGKCPI
ncbi:hypothetical protein GIB67_033897 [Kingdonia uniflora]|uniref:Ubiquitin-like protease family profile domain-containing protein n=1 Tax=Kingdonia uniflora TaxID=39325 RepID=A0A7J7NBQ7_9MAGN|nr:hypothetical protein GIB67_033897 [Kingdonia uniflora]